MSRMSFLFSLNTLRLPRLSRELTIVLLAGSLTMAAPLFAAEPELITDRPDQTESPQTVKPGSVQIEIGASFTNDEDGGIETDSFSVPETLVRIGLTARTELRVGWSGRQDVDIRIGRGSFSSTGSGDAELGIKLALTDNDQPGTQVGLLLSSSVPVGDDEFTSDSWDLSARVLVAHTLTDSVSFSYNLGVETFTEDDGFDEDTLAAAIYTATLGFGLTDSLGAFLEIYGEIGLSAGGKPQHLFDGGFTYLVRDNVQLDIVAGVGISDPADDWFVGVGVSFRLPG